MMTQIYSAASAVFVWIGDADQETFEAFRFATWLSDTFCTKVMAATFMYPLMGTIDIDVDETLKALPSDDASWLAWVRVLQKPWFERVWVMQEVSYCANTQVYCGEHQIAYEVLWNSISTLGTYPAIESRTFAAVTTAEGSDRAYYTAKKCQAVVQGLSCQMPVLLRLMYKNKVLLGPEPRPS